MIQIHDVFLGPSQSHCMASPVVSSLSWSYLVNDTVDYLFGVESGGGKDGVGLITTHIFSHKCDCLIYGGDFVLSQSSDYSYMNHSNKYRYFYS